MKKVGIILIALALFIAGSAMADSGIEATKQISFIGANGAGITSTDMSSVSGYSPAFSNMVDDREFLHDECRERQDPDEQQVC